MQTRNGKCGRIVAEALCYKPTVICPRPDEAIEFIFNLSKPSDRSISWVLFRFSVKLLPENISELKIAAGEQG
jgi:hypothetical protein